MAFKPGYLSYFNLDNGGGSPTNLSGYTDDASLPQTRSTLDVSVFGGGAVKQFITGLSGGDVFAIKGPYDATLHSHLGSCLAAQDAGTASFSFIWGPGGSVSGQAKISGEALVSGYTLSATVAGRGEWTASLQVSGAVTNSVW
jgi:hypothetical protein